MNKDVPEIRSISRSHGHHTVSLAFSPPFPNLKAFTGDTAKGWFEISGDVTTGFIHGEYRVDRSNDRITIEMIPSGGWIPNESKVSLRFLYNVEPMFMQWPKTYRWKAELEPSRDSGFRMISSWKRIHSDDPQ